MIFLEELTTNTNEGVQKSFNHYSSWVVFSHSAWIVLDRPPPNPERPSAPDRWNPSSVVGKALQLSRSRETA